MQISYVILSPDVMNENKIGKIKTCADKRFCWVVSNEIFLAMMISWNEENIM